MDKLNNLNTSNISSKIKKIINESNKILLENLNLKESYDKLHKQFIKLIRFSKLRISKLNNVNDFIDFMFGLQKIFKSLDIKKLYNLSNRNNLKEFDKLNLFSQFFYISIPYKNKHDFNFIKGGVCYHRTTFFYNLFNYVDKNNKLNKKIIYFNGKFTHSVFLIGYKNKNFIIDPYDKSTFITEVKKGNKIYLSMGRNGIFYGTIEDDKKLLITYNNEKVKFDVYEDKEKFFENIKPNKRFLVNVKTYLDGKATHLIIKQYDKFILINFDGYEQLNDRESTIMNIMNPIMEGEVRKINSFFLLKQILGIKELPGENDEIIKRLKVISDKLSPDYLLEKLGIKEDIKMFK